MLGVAVPAGTGEVITGTVLVVSGIALLRASWRRRDGAKGRLLLGGWLLIAAGLLVLSWMWGGELGTAYGLLIFSAIGYGAVAAGARRRRRRRTPREPALEPEERPTNWRRGTGKALLAIVLAGIASLGLGIAFAVAMPMPVHDRIVIGGLLVPVLWGGGMAWTLSDARLMRATIVLIAAASLGYGVVFLPKVLP